MRRRTNNRSGRVIGILALLCLAVADGRADPVAVRSVKGACVPPGRWVDPATKQVIDEPIARFADRAVILLGETHTSADDHRWQLDTLSALRERRPRLVVGYEMFPRAKQKVLDRWMRSTLSPKQFLETVEWKRVWGFNPELYLPLFNWNRLHRVKMVALNVEPEVPRKIGRDGIEALTPDERGGIGTPAPALDSYRQRLADVMGNHGKSGKAPAMPPEKLDKFVAAQQFWDRAMAEGLAKAAGGEDPPLAVGIIGSGHLTYREGVAYQLADLGIDDVAILLPWPADRDCSELDPGIADAVFGMPTLPDDPEDQAATPSPPSDQHRPGKPSPHTVPPVPGLPPNHPPVTPHRRQNPTANGIIPAGLRP